jgi:hypothetical protein
MKPHIDLLLHGSIHNHPLQLCLKSRSIYVLNHKNKCMQVIRRYISLYSGRANNLPAEARLNHKDVG